jgi:acetylornithine deacetylase/succinyl-diaminopimelate desuccinylase-like protein
MAAPAPARPLAPAADAPFDWAPIEAEALASFQTLIRFDTTNPPGNEKAAAEFVAGALRESGLEPKVLDSAPGRSNVVVRYKGDGSKPPLLLNAHLDVVEAEPSTWKHPPFGGEIHDGYVWGRGAVDMKHMAAMSTAVMKLLAGTKAKLKRDVIFTAVADEEAGSRYGAEYLVAEHRDLVQCEYALGEIGGFSLHLNGVSYYPIQVAQKGTVWGRLKVKGEPGHGSMPRPDSAVLKLGELISRLGSARFPFHASESVNDMIEALAKEQKFPLSVVLRAVTNPAFSKLVLKLFPNPGTARAFAALLSNTATPTVVRAGNKTNVIPGFGTVEFDGRTAPGQTQEDLLRELREVVGPEAEIEVMDSTPPVATTKDTELYRSLGETIRRADPNGIPIPYVIPGFTDARAFDKLGAKYYGFAPIRFDPTHDVAFAEMYHGNNERCPVDGFHWGLRTLYDAVTTFCSQ